MKLLLAVLPVAIIGFAVPAHADLENVSVTMQNVQFHPQAITVKLGTTIVWTNQDYFDHNVTAVSGASFKSQNLEMGQTYSYKMTKPGTINYVCTNHPGMTGTIRVT